MTSEHVIRVTVGQSSARSAARYSLRSSAASETRPAKDEILVMERGCLPSVWMRRRAGSLPTATRVTGLRYSGPLRSEETAGESVVD
jgi:hypothetical protein